MRATTGLALAVGLCVIGSLAAAKLAPERNALHWTGTRYLGQPIVYRNLAIVPIYDRSSSGNSHYATLDEGLANKTVIVKEADGGGSVNTLYITNNGNAPIYIMAGEVVLGGRQDRILGRDIIIPPRKAGIPITVFCVEHGRWTGTTEFAKTAASVAAQDIRGYAQDGAFAGSSPARSGAPIGAAQTRVWDKVAEKNRAFGAQPASGTYRNVLELDAAAARSGTAPYITAISREMARRDRPVGVAIAVNNEFVTADLFHSPALFRKLWPKLLRAYAADAVQYQSRPVAGSSPSANAARQFLVIASDATSKQESKTDAAVNFRLESHSTLTYQMMPSAGGGVVHENMLRK